MPIEITELLIRAQVGDRAENTASSTTGSQGNEQENQGTCQATEKNLAEALDIIRRKNER